MKETTITFTPAAGLRKGLSLLGQGIALTARSLLRLYNQSIHRHPYPHIAFVLLTASVASVVCIAEARQERDTVNKRNYQLQQRIDSLQLSCEAKTYRIYAEH